MMRLIVVSCVTFLASLGCVGTPALAQGVATTPDSSAMWEGTWLTADSSLEDNVYFMLWIGEAGRRSFRYELENRAVPYGPNAERSGGSAEFRDATEAVDSESGRTFRLRVDPEDRDERVIETDGESFFFQRTGSELAEQDAQANPLEEAEAFLDGMVVCLNENFAAIVESSEDTAPDFDELGARCGLDQDALSESADALVQDALIDHFLSAMETIASGDVEVEAALTMLVDAFARAADDIRTMQARGQLDQASEREVLEAFYRATGGPDWQFREAWLSDLPLSAWSGISTNDQGRVRVLGKANAGARGPIPPELGRLGSLEVLMLSFNEFSGPLPPELGQLTRLEELLLNNNRLSGPIPVEFGNLAGLTELSIDGDTGLCLPAQIQDTVFGRMAIGNFVPLCTAPSSDREVLAALYSTITGFFRPSNWLSDAPLSAWSGVTANDQGRVERLDLAPHRLAGPIPPELGRLTSLVSLYLFFNESSGPIPPELGQLTNLVRLGLVGTEQGGLSGPIPPEFGQLINLQELSLNNNRLNGPIPVELGELVGLTELSMDGDTGLCLPPEIQDTVFGRLAIGNVPLCGTGGAETDGGNLASTEEGSDLPGDVSDTPGFEPPVVNPEPEPTTPIADDHGDSPDAATRVGVPSDTAGILTPNDADYFRIDLSTAARLRIWTEGDVDTIGRLEDGDGSMLASDDDSAADYNFEMQVTVPSGTSYVRVAGYSDIDTGSYSLRLRLLEETPPIHGITWFAENVNPNGELERWQVIIDQDRAPFSGTLYLSIRESGEDRTRNGQSVTTTVTATYTYPDVVLNWMIAIADDRDEAYECGFSGAMESDGGAISGTVVCEAEERFERQLRFERTFG